MQPKRRDTGHTGIKGCNLNLSDAIKSLNSQIDDAFSGQPEFKKTVLQGGNALINEQLPILIHCSYIKRFLGQFPLTGGHVMRDSFMCLSYIGRHRHQHPVLRQRYHLPGSVSKFKDHLVRINEAFALTKLLTSLRVHFHSLAMAMASTGLIFSKSALAVVLLS
jgi:hypothetical protein